TPDLMTFAKGLGNGLAIGGGVGRGETMACPSATSISTFGGDPVATAGALAVPDYAESHELQRNAALQGTRFVAGQRAAVDDHPAIGDVRGKGLMVGLEFVEPGGQDPSPALATAVLEETGARGVLVGKGGLHGNVIRLAPPMTITSEEVDEGLAAIRDAVAAAQEVTR